jgi:hypothetical protein
MSGVGKLFASLVSRQLRDAGHERSMYTDDDEWTPGFRAEQAGDRVQVSYPGPLGRGNLEAEYARLGEYRLALENLGYVVALEPGRLIVTRRAVGHG